jgi:hypothetical protein
MLIENLKKWWILWIWVMLLFLVLFFGLRGSTVPKFEYKITAPEDYELEMKCNEMGADGWEMVTARRATHEEPYIPGVQSRHDEASYEIIWKREVR